MKSDVWESSLYKELEDFIKKEIGIKVNEDTVFFKGLKLIGNDADIFMLKLSETFKIDMTGFKFEDYFIDEYNIPFLYLYDRLFRKEKIKRKEFDIKYLVKIIEEKRWIDV
ncbi:MAG: DUF1493 family protein [Salinivirgaceae bacterium]|nr:DUF1493 family protein [Salinivirgaceae bacterium]